MRTEYRLVLILKHEHIDLCLTHENCRYHRLMGKLKDVKNLYLYQTIQLFVVKLTTTDPEIIDAAHTLFSSLRYTDGLHGAYVEIGQDPHDFVYEYVGHGDQLLQISFDVKIRQD